MTDWPNFLAAIVERPDDDLPRLVAADYAEENGESARAEFIRVQCELERLESERASTGKSGWKTLKIRSAFEKLRTRESALFNGYKCEWFGDRWEAETLPGLSHAIIRRGFVSEIRLTLAAFVGGECPECNGTGCPDGRNTQIVHGTHCDDCPVCHGTGRTPGCAKEVFANHPVERVVLTDREPFNASYQDGGPWIWWPCREGNSPNLIFHLLPLYFAPLQEEGRHRSRQAALEALSAACVVYGRALAFPTLAESSRAIFREQTPAPPATP